MFLLTVKVLLTAAPRGRCSDGSGGRRRPPTGHRTPRTEQACAAHPTAPGTTETQKASGLSNHGHVQTKADVVLIRYLKSSEAETVEQGHGDQAAKEAVDRRDQTRSS